MFKDIEIKRFDYYITFVCKCGNDECVLSDSFNECDCEDCGRGYTYSFKKRKVIRI